MSSVKLHGGYFAVVEGEAAPADDDGTWADVSELVGRIICSASAKSAEIKAAEKAHE